MYNTFEDSSTEGRQQNGDIPVHRRPKSTSNKVPVYCITAEKTKMKISKKESTKKEEEKEDHKLHVSLKIVVVYKQPNLTRRPRFRHFLLTLRLMIDVIYTYLDLRCLKILPFSLFALEH